ncbi:MAG: S8 family serine peptidase [Acidobacteriia bacterium]|nr:S8 family serine peptidase [Terriglobia bacterium]
MKRRLFCHAVLLVSAAAGLMAQPAPADRVRVLIGFDRLPGASEQTLVRAFGGAVRHTYRFIPAIAATLPQWAVTALSNNPIVSVIEPDVAIYALDEYDNAWGVKTINARAVHNGGNRGQGVKVCVIDSGIDATHPDLYQYYAGGYDFVNDDDNPADDNGHGTHVAGTIAALANNTGVIGVAPQASILAYKILGADGSGSFSDAIAAVERCAADGGKITSNSYGSTADPGSLVKAAFDKAAAEGILHVAAAGNARSIFACNAVAYPARYASVVAVGATDSSDKVASFSCRGAEVELAAPGVNIQSTWPGGAYATASGTSMATPHVSGLAALVLGCGLVDLNNDGVVDGADVRLRMQQTALDLGTAGRDTSYGFGRIRADLAATNCGVLPPPVTLPAAPTNLRVTASTRNSVSLAWNDNSANEANFVVERCSGANCGNFAVVATLPANTATYANSGLARRTTYSFRVKAVNSGGSSAYTNTAKATTQ